MLRDINSLTGHRIQATDGELGKVSEFYFDDQTWDIRYLVVETGNWLSGRKVLITPAALKAPEWRAKTFPVALTREQVRKSPDIDTDRTVTRQHEQELHEHYAWPLYWGEGFYSGGMGSGLLVPPRGLEDENRPAPADRPRKDNHLQSTREVKGYRIHALDGLIGHVADYIIDDGQWIIRYLVADTGVWLPGRKVLLSPNWIESVDWETSEVFVDLARDIIKSSPEFDPSQPVLVDYETRLYEHYRRPGVGSGAGGNGGLPRGRRR